jgi:hypothetical protein
LTLQQSLVPARSFTEEAVIDASTLQGQWRCDAALRLEIRRRWQWRWWRVQYSMPPKPLEGNFLLAPLFVQLSTLRGDALFGASFSLEQEGSAAATTPSVDAISGAALLKARRRHSVHSILLSCPSSMPGTALGAAPVILHTELLIIWLTAMPAMMPRGHLEGGS